MWPKNEAKPVEEPPSEKHYTTAALAEHLEILADQSTRPEILCAAAKRLREYLRGEVK